MVTWNYRASTLHEARWRIPRVLSLACKGPWLAMAQPEGRLAVRRRGTKRGAAAQAAQAAPGSSDATPALEDPTLAGLQSMGMVVTPHAVDSKEAQAIMKLVQCFVCPDGRACLLCGVKDTEVDHVYGSRTIIWAYPPSADGKNSGMVPG